MMLDEMSCEKVGKLDVRDDLIMGSAKKMLVVLLRGMFEEWPQVVYNFNQNVDGNLVNQKKGSIVRALVFDSGNPILVKDLQIQHDNYKMKNPTFH